MKTGSYSIGRDSSDDRTCCLYCKIWSMGGFQDFTEIRRDSVHSVLDRQGDLVRIKKINLQRSCYYAAESKIPT